MDNYILCEGKPPCCIGCSNYDGWCGTPCVDCDIIAIFNNEWEVYIVHKDFVIYKRKECKDAT